jgi:type I restriction enzyme S subunit
MKASSRPIKEYCVGIYDGPHATPMESPEGPVFLGIKNMTEDGRLDFTEIRHVSEEEFPRWTRRVTPQAGDVVFTYEATLHRYAVIPEGFRGCLGRRVALVRPDTNKVDHRFLLYYFLSSAWRHVVESNVITGATVDRIPLERFPEFPASLPSLPVQERIADILSAYDDLIENNRRRMTLLEEAVRQLYREWFVRLRFPGHEHTPITNGVPDGWEKTNALEGMSVLSGGTPKTTVTDYWDGEIPFYTPKDASDQCYVLETERSITELGLKNCNSRLYSTDTVFISARGTVGKLNLAYQPMAMSQSCYALIGKSHVSQFFLYCALQESIEYLKQHAVGAVFDAIVVDTFKLIPFMVPDGKNVRLFDGSVAPMFRQVGNLLEQNQKLRAARDLLLPRLMSGEIAV